MQLLNERLLHLALTSSVAILKSGISSYTGICQFQSPKKAKKKFLCSNFRRPKVSTLQREVGCSCFPRLASCTRKKSYPFTPAGECVQSVQSLEERLEDLRSLSLNFCLTKFVRTIERAFVQVLHSFAN